MQVTDYVKPELLVVALVLYFLDTGLKKSALIKEKYVLFLTGGIGIVICALYVFTTSPCSCPKDVAMALFTSITQGILLAGLSTYAKQMIGQIKQK